MRHFVLKETPCQPHGIDLKDSLQVLYHSSWGLSSAFLQVLHFLECVHRKRMPASVHKAKVPVTAVHPGGFSPDDCLG